MSVSPIEAHLGLQAGELQSGDLTLYLCSPLMEALPLSYMCAFGKLVCERFLTASVQSCGISCPAAPWHMFAHHLFHFSCVLLFLLALTEGSALFSPSLVLSL